MNMMLKCLYLDSVEKTRIPLHPCWFNSQRYFISVVLDKELLTENARYLWWADEDFFEKYKQWLWDEYRATVGTVLTFKGDNPDISSTLDEWIDFEDSRQAELFVLKFSK